MNVATGLEIAGWIGVVAQLGAYALVSRGSLSGTSSRYHSANVVGAALVAASATALGNWAVVVGQLVWLGLGAAALARAARVCSPARPVPPADVTLPRRAQEPEHLAPLIRTGAPEVCAFAPH